MDKLVQAKNYNTIGRINQRSKSGKFDCVFFLPRCVEDEEGDDSENEDHGKFTVFPLLVRSSLSSLSLALGNVINV